MSITYLEAIREAQAKLLRDDERVFIYGQDVGGTFGGAFKATKNLAKEFPGTGTERADQRRCDGRDRDWGGDRGDAADYRNAVRGFLQRWAQPNRKPCRDAFLAHEHAGSHHDSSAFRRNNRQRTVSQPNDGINLRALSGLIVMTPATVEDAYSMLLEAVAIDDPVVFCEHKYLYYHLKADKLPTEGLPTGKARIAREGRDLTIVTYSAMVHEALAVAEQLAGEGIEIEVVDLRSVKPLDTDTVLASVARTGRLLCVGESFPWGGVTAEVIARVAAEGFHLLDAAPQRFNAKDTPIPYHPNLWSTHSPNAKEIARKTRALLRE